MERYGACVLRERMLHGVSTMIRARPAIKLWRDKIRGITNEQLAKELSEGRRYHYDTEWISSIVNGDREPSKQLMKKFCLLLGCDFGDIWTFDRDTRRRGKNGRSRG